jgi:secreted PhoX family phosphatase
MGKYTPELAAMMPDNKTAYMTDDGSFGGFYMYIADKASDLSSGTLYMAKWTQLSAYPTTSTTLPATYPDGSPTIKGDTSDGGRGALTWVKLGSATDAEVKAIVDKRPTLSDIFQIGNIPVRTSTAGAISTQALCGALGVGYKLITAGAYDVEYRGINMCLRLRDGNNGTTISSKFSTQAEVLKAAAFLETRKYGSYLGATAEFEKEEGIVYNPDSNVIYMTMGRLRFGMDIVGTSSNSFGPSGGDDHVQLDRNDCGAIYEIKLGSSQKDTSGNSIGSSFTGTEMKSIIVGKRLNAGELYADKNRCHPDYISLPDALNYSKGTLFIGEDSSSHFNNSAWAYDLAKKKLTRIMTIPTGSEFTGNFVHLEDGDRLNIFVSVQHPYSDEVFDGNTEQPINWSYNANATKEQKRAYIGYIYGLPRLTNTTNTTYTPDPNQ